MKKLISVSTLAVLSLALAAPAGANTVRHDTAGVQMDIPDDWKQSATGGLLTILEPKEEVLLQVGVVPAKDLKKALANASKSIKKTFKKVSHDKGTETTVNGMPALMVKGKGLYQDVPVKIALTVIITKTGRAVMILGVAKDATFDSHKGRLAKIFESIRPL